MTNQVLGVLNSPWEMDLRSLLETEVKPNLTPTISSYARGRKECWLIRKAPLSAKQGWRDALRCPELESLLLKLWDYAEMPGSLDTALAIYGSKGISAHRDASFASEIALSVNLGRAEWGWNPVRGCKQV